ncbi:MAG TPA: hypothetical protein DIW30_00620 [Bacteroidales bacterium]|nr:hypothetical protein [Bacteroidales bacterium]
MKRLLIVYILCTFSFALLGANEKVVDRSARHAPDWLYGMQKNYIITTSEGSTIDIARDLAMQSVKERILTAVAEHVESEAQTSLTETTHNGDIETLTIFSKQIASHSAYIPFLNDVSEAHAEDYYWEKIQKDKNTFYYRYNIKYPFSSGKSGISSPSSSSMRRIWTHRCRLSRRRISLRSLLWNRCSTGVPT